MRSRLGERGAPPRPSVAKTRESGVTEERRIHRNTLLENAAAGWYGAELRRAATAREGLRELVDKLEQLEGSGALARGGLRVAAATNGES